jgi:hypothetical protein
VVCRTSFISVSLLTRWGIFDGGRHHPGDCVTRYSLPFHRRVTRGARRWLNSAVDFLRTPIRRPVVLLVSNEEQSAKAQEVGSRLRYLFAHMGRTFTLRTVRRASPFDYLRNTAVVAVDATAVPRVARRYVRWVADLDYETNPTDGWALMDLGVAIAGGPRRDTVSAARQTFVDQVRRLQADGPRPAYLFGTGPSLQLAGDHSFTDGVAVVCNTIVRDPKLWHHLEPAFLTAGDAIYHFGHNAHARAFRADALRRLQESEGRTLFVYPATYDVIVRSELVDVESVLVPIPWGEDTDISVDLTKRFALPYVANVLNALLLPLGCTISNDVRLWGFDGRSPHDRGFWANSNVHAYPELMQFIRDAHPAFFANLVPEGNEVRYVKQVHGDWLDERLSDAERRGFHFSMLHRSWTPTLQKRFREWGTTEDGNTTS